MQNLSPWVSYIPGILDSAVGMNRPSPDCEGYLRSGRLEGTPVTHGGKQQQRASEARESGRAAMKAIRKQTRKQKRDGTGS